MEGTDITKTADLFGLARSTVSKVMNEFKKKRKKPLHWSKTQEERKLLGTVGFLRGFLGRITRIQLRKLQQNFMTISRALFFQKLSEKNCTKSDFMEGLPSENHIKINLFEISQRFRYFLNSYI